jgi:high-affinity Fe2+/Pb2+ permease
MALTRKHWLAFIGLEIVLFVLAGVTSKNSHNPGTVSNIFWVAFLIGVVLLVVLGVIALIRSQRR